MNKWIFCLCILLHIAAKAQSDLVGIVTQTEDILNTLGFDLDLG